MSKENININHEDVLLNHIKNFFRISMLNVSKEQIKDIKQTIIESSELGQPYEKYKIFDYLFQKLEPLNPDILFYWEHYHLDGIEDICIYIVWYKIKQLKIEINKQLLHEFAYQAQQEHDNWLYGEKGNVKDYFHAVNKVLKIYKDGNWRTPDDFLETYPQYEKRIEIALD